MTLNKLLSTVAITAAFAWTALPAAAQDCPRGDLDERFCDADGDLIADIPTDPAEWIDPDELIFAYTPVEDPAVYKTAWADFLTHLEAETGKKVVFFPVQNNAAQIEAMRSGRLHISGFNTGSNPLAVNCAGFRPFTIMAAPDGSSGRIDGAASIQSNAGAASSVERLALTSISKLLPGSEVRSWAAAAPDTSTTTRTDKSNDKAATTRADDRRLLNIPGGTVDELMGFPRIRYRRCWFRRCLVTDGASTTRRHHTTINRPPYPGGLSERGPELAHERASNNEIVGG